MKPSSRPTSELPGTAESGTWHLPGIVGRTHTGLAASLLAVALLTSVLAPALDEAQLLDVALLYLTVTLLSAALWGYTVGIATAIVSGLTVNFFFVPPLHRFTVQSPENAIALLLFLAVALVGASMLASW